MTIVEREIGKVKWLHDTKGYGFIERPQGGDVFVHSSSVRETGFKMLTQGQRVEYVVAWGPIWPFAQDVGPAAGEILQRVREIEAANTATAVADTPVETETETEEGDLALDETADGPEAEEESPSVTEAPEEPRQTRRKKTA